MNIREANEQAAIDAMEIEMATEQSACEMMYKVCGIVSDFLETEGFVSIGSLLVELSQTIA